jgi:hypothetical protein
MMGPSVLVSGLVAIGLGINAYEDWKSQTIRVDVALLTLGLALMVMTKVNRVEGGRIRERSG